MSSKTTTRDAYDVVIIGNGAVACAIALRFADEYPDAKLALVGPRARSGAASLAAGAMLGAFGELGEGALGDEHARAKFEAARAATAMWPAHLERLNARLVESERVQILEGTYIVSRSEEETEEAADPDPDPDSDADPDPDPDSDPDPDPDFRAVLAALAQTNTPFSLVDPRDLPDLSPPPRGLPRRAVFVPGEGAIATRALHRAYDEALARAANVTVIDAEAIAITPSKNPAQVPIAVTLSANPSHSTLRARHVVLAAGTASQRLIDELGLSARIPRLVHGVGVAVVVEAAVALPRAVVRTPNRGLAGGLYSVPYPAPFAYLGATTSLQLGAEPAAGAASAAARGLLQAAARHLHHGLSAARLHKILVGSRPTPLDTYPLFGQTSLEGIWLATGTKRDGLHLSPKLAAEMVAALGGGPPPLGNRFAPERELLLPRTRDLARSIDRAAEVRLRVHRSLARSLDRSHDRSLDRSPAQLPPAALDREAQRAAVAAIYERCARAGLVAADREIAVELLEVFSALAASLVPSP